VSASPDPGTRTLLARGRRRGPVPGLWTRPVSRLDLERVAAVEQAIYAFPWTAGNFGDSLLAGYDCWLYEEDDGQLAGYAIVMWLPDEVHLLNLSIAAKRQRQGIGRAVLEWLCRDAAERGAQGMLLEVRPSNVPALSLYESAGFSRIGIRKRYYPAAEGAREDAWVLFRRFADTQAAQRDE
jgi:ribosomal-protein-alanine acetyltransferase